MRLGANTGCAENGLLLTRRSMLGLSAALFTSAMVPSGAFADTNADARLLVVILRGGMDGLNLLVPSFDPDYERVRQHLAVPRSEALELSQGFFLHPAMPNLQALYRRGEVSFVPAAGLPLRNRSHFECQENLENGLASNSSAATGWINRFMASLPSGDPVRGGKALAIGDAPLIIQGSESFLGWSNTWFSRASSTLVSGLRSMYQNTDPSLLDALDLGIESDRLAGGAASIDDYDRSPLINGFGGAARLLSLNAGPRVAVVSVDGWDTHLDQGVLTGMFADRLSLLDEAIRVFRAGMGSNWSNTVVVIATEFGRTAAANGTRGTDHGVGMPVLLAGGALHGGIFGDWPGLRASDLYEGRDLFPAVDIRSVFKGVLRDHFGVSGDRLDTFVFPESRSIIALSGLVRRDATRASSESSRQAATTPLPHERSPIGAYRAEHGVSG